MWRSTSSNLVRGSTVSAPVAWPTIRGKKAGSWNEYWLSIALDILKIDYLYQVSYWGGRNLRGGQVLDFLIWPTRGAMEKGVQVFGEYWHEGNMTSKDRLNLVLLEQFLGHPVIVLWDSETANLEISLATARRKLL